MVIIEIIFNVGFNLASNFETVIFININIIFKIMDIRRHLLFTFELNIAAFTEYIYILTFDV